MKAYMFACGSKCSTSESVTMNSESVSMEKPTSTECDIYKMAGVTQESLEVSGTEHSEATELPDYLNTQGINLALVTAAHWDGKLECKNHWKHKTKMAEGSNEPVMMQEATCCCHSCPSCEGCVTLDSTSTDGGKAQAYVVKEASEDESGPDTLAVGTAKDMKYKILLSTPGEKDETAESSLNSQVPYSAQWTQEEAYCPVTIPYC